MQRFLCTFPYYLVSFFLFLYINYLKIDYPNVLHPNDHVLGVIFLFGILFCNVGDTFFLLKVCFTYFGVS